jgi:hypothetical protein
VVEVVWSTGVEDFHHICASAESTDREAAADDLAHRRQVGTNAEDLLEAADAEPESYDLVADEERPVFVRQASGRREVIRGAGEDPRPSYGLEEYRRHLLAFLDERESELDLVVEGLEETQRRFN